MKSTNNTIKGRRAGGAHCLFLLDPVPKHAAGRIGTQDGERVPRRSFSTRRDGNTRMQFINTKNPESHDTR